MAAVADGPGSVDRLRGGDVSDRQGDRGDRSVAGRLVGAFALAACYAVLVWLIRLHRGAVPEVSLAIAIGTFVGLASLVMEIAIVGRSMRLVELNGMNATLTTFGIRLGTVGAFGGWFIALGAVDSEAFCLSYFATFFLYLCWLTWRIYNEPVHYDAAKAARNAAAKAQAATPGQPATSGQLGRREPVAGGVA